jgi:hypothetical protein
MPAGGNQTLARQVVEFVSQGLDQVKGAMSQVKAGLDDVTSAANAMAWGFAEAGETTFAERLKDAFKGMADQVLNTSARVAAFRTALDTGAYATVSAQLRQVNAEMERLQKLAKWQDLVAQRGVLGAWLQTIQDKAREVAGSLGKLFGGGGPPVSAAAIGLAVTAFQSLTNAARGWVQTGLQGTTTGNLLATQFQFLGREVAAVFLPTLNAVIDRVRDLTNWFRRLTGDQQDNIRRWVEAAGAFVLTQQILTRVAATIGGVVIPMVKLLGSVVTGEAFTVAGAIGLATGGLSILVGALSVAASAAVGFAVGTQSGREALANLWQAVRPVVDGMRGLVGVLGGVWGGVAEQVGGSIGRIARVVAGTLGPVLAGVTDVAGRFGATFLQFVADVLPRVESAVAAVLPVFAGLGGQLVQLGRTLYPVFQTLFDGTGPGVRLLVAGLQLVATQLGLVLRVTVAVWQGLATLFTDLIPRGINFLIQKVADLVAAFASMAARIPVFGRQVADQLRALSDGIRGVRFEFGRPQAVLPEPEGRGGQHRSVTLAGGGPEGVEDMFRRIQTAANRVAAERRDEQNASNLAAIAAAAATIAANTATGVAGNAGTNFVAAPGTLRPSSAAGLPTYGNFERLN